MLKKIILAVAAVGVSSAAFSHDGWDRRDRDRNRARERRIERVHEERRPVVERAPVIVEPGRHDVYAPPAPVYRQPGVSVSVNLPW